MGKREPNEKKSGRAAKEESQSGRDFTSRVVAVAVALEVKKWILPLPIFASCAFPLLLLLLFFLLFLGFFGIPRTQKAKKKEEEEVHKQCG